MEIKILEGVVIGAVGGSLAGITLYLVQYFHNLIKEESDKDKVYRWLKQNTSNNDGKRFRSTRAIASWTNLTQDRVRYICSIEKRIFLSTGKTDDIWGIYARRDPPGNTGDLI